MAYMLNGVRTTTEMEYSMDKTPRKTVIVAPRTPTKTAPLYTEVQLKKMTVKELKKLTTYKGRKADMIGAILEAQ